MNRFRRQTLEQALAIANPGPLEWPEETAPGILHLLWTAYDRLLSTKLSKINIHEADLQLERAITALLSDEIQDILHEEGRNVPNAWQRVTLQGIATMPDSSGNWGSS